MSLSEFGAYQFDVKHPLFDTALVLPKAIRSFFPGTASIYQGYFGTGATPLIGTGSLVAGPSVAPFTTNFYGLGLFTGVHTTVGANITLGSNIKIGAADISLSAIMSGFNLFRGKVIPKDSTTTPSWEVRAADVNIYGARQSFRGSGSLIGLWTYNGSTICAPCPSDEKAKVEIIQLEGSLDKVLSLRGVSFKWNSEVVPKKAETQEKSVGLIAQEVEKVIPEVVVTEQIEGQKLKTVEYGNLVGILIEAIKEQQQQIEDLKTRITELESK